jgi:hypothetical protein
VKDPKRLQQMIEALVCRAVELKLRTVFTKSNLIVQSQKKLFSRIVSKGWLSVSNVVPLSHGYISSGLRNIAF